MTPAEVQQNRTATFECPPGTFRAGEQVRFTITGVNREQVPVALPAPADVAANGSSATTVRRAGAHGAASIRLHALARGAGTFRVTVSGASRTVTSRLSIFPADGAGRVQDAAVPADLATVGSRAGSVFGWVVAIIAMFAAAAYLSDRSGSASRAGSGPGAGSGPAEV